MRACIFPAQVVRVVGDDDRDFGLLREPVDRGGEAFVLLQAVVLNLEEEVVLAENVRVGQGQAAGVVVAVREDGLVHVAAQARRHGNQTLRVARQQVFINPRLVVEALEIGGRNQVDEIAVAFLALAQQHQVVVAVGIRARFVALLRDVHLAADHRLDALRPRGIVELHGAEEVAVVGHRHRGHLLLRYRVDQLADFAGSIEQRIVGVAMKVYERLIRHSLPAGGGVVGTGRFELPTFRLGGGRSIQLSYVPAGFSIYCSVSDLSLQCPYGNAFLRNEFGSRRYRPPQSLRKGRRRPP